jgi:predicted ATPase/DNA-binding CsgD family transcriptional regulator
MRQGYSGAPPGRVRGEFTEFVGRRAELTHIREALGPARLVTLAGPGGIGKTRLALQAASSARRAFRDGVWMTELAGLRDPALLVPEIARSLGLLDQSARWAVATLSDYLAARQALLVLDNCEQLLDACAVLADALLRACPELRIIATSRQVLGVAGEVTIAVPPMSVPVPTRPQAPEELLKYEAVRLFVGRGSGVLPGFALDGRNGPAVADLCRRLEGIPLAIELAAVRLRSLSPEQILSHLHDRFQMLSRGGAAAEPRHQTMQATLDWSYDLLTEPERWMWRRVSVFAGSFDLDAAEAVCTGDGIAAETIIDLIDGLVAKSILLRRAGHGRARYRLLDTIREYGQQKIRAEGNERPLRARHRSWYAGLAARQEAFGHRRSEWISDLDTDHENLRAALEFSLSDPQEVAAGVELACDLWVYWETHGHLTEGRRTLAAALAQLPETVAVRPRALWVAGYLALIQADLPDARTLLEAALSAAGLADDINAVAYASSFLGYLLCYLGDPGQGRTLARTALKLHRESGDQIGVALALAQIGLTHQHAGEAQAAADRWGESVRVCEASGNVWYQANSQWGLGVAEWLLGNLDKAALLECAALRTMRHMDDPMGVVLCLDALASIAVRRKQAVRALTLLGGADAAWAAIPAARQPALCGYYDAALAAARETLPESASAAAFAKGTAMSQAEAIAFALGEPPGPAPRPRAGSPAKLPGTLTRRELEVAAQVAQGLSNRHIAAALVISPRTAETHVQHIMDKLGFSTRAQVAAWAAGSGPPDLAGPGSAQPENT